MFFPCVLASLAHFIFSDMLRWVGYSYFPPDPSPAAVASPFLLHPFNVLYLALNQEKTIIQIHKGKLIGRAEPKLRQLEVPGVHAL